MVFPHAARIGGCLLGVGLMYTSFFRRCICLLYLQHWLLDLYLYVFVVVLVVAVVVDVVVATVVAVLSQFWYQN